MFPSWMVCAIPGKPPSRPFESPQDAATQDIKSEVEKRSTVPAGASESTSGAAAVSQGGTGSLVLVAVGGSWALWMLIIW